MPGSRNRSNLWGRVGRLGGHGTHANPDGPVPLTNWPNEKPKAYALGQLNGTLRVLPTSLAPAQLASFTQRVVAANNWQQKHTAQRYPLVLESQWDCQPS
jgi:hypothetical protein